MMRWQLVAALALLCTTSGCHLQQLRTANEDLERENFQLEQRLDELTWQLEDAKSALQTCQACATAPGSSTSSSTPGPTTKPRRTPLFSSPSRQDSSPAPDADIEAPKVELPDEEMRNNGARRRPREFVPRFTGPPVISPPDPHVPEGMSRPTAAAPENSISRGAEELPSNQNRYAPVSARPGGAEPDAPPADRGAYPPEALAPEEIPPRAEPEVPAYAPPMEAPPYDSTRRAPAEELPGPPPAAPGPKAHLASQSRGGPVSALVINPKLTVWRKTGGDSSVDEGLQVVVVPRDAAGQVVPASGIMAIAVIDPSGEGDAARLARWNFSAEQVAEKWQSGASGAGLHFTLQWPNAVPTRDDLMLFVRLTTEDGQQFVAEFALRPTSGNNPAAWNDVEDRPRTTANRASGPVTMWKRATAPLPEREPSAVVALPAEKPKTPEPVEETAAAPEATGPSWSPYR